MLPSEVLFSKESLKFQGGQWRKNTIILPHSHHQNLIFSTKTDKAFFIHTSTHSGLFPYPTSSRAAPSLEMFSYEFVYLLKLGKSSNYSFYLAEPLVSAGAAPEQAGPLPLVAHPSPSAASPPPAHFDFPVLLAVAKPLI